MNVSLKVSVQSQIPETLRQAEKALDQAIRAAAHAVQGGAIAHTTRVDTGAMKNGWCVQSRQESDYGNIVATAKGRNPSAETFPEERVSESLKAVVANVMEYAFFHEYGSVRVSPAPMLAPALETAKANFERLVKEALRG